MMIPTRTALALTLILNGTLALAFTLALIPADSAGADGPARLAVDPQGSEVTFLMDTTWHAVHGKARGISGTIESAKGSLFEDAVVTIVVDATTLETGNERRDRTMHGEYMITKEWPRVTFRSTAAPVLLGEAPPAAGEPRLTEGGVVSFELAGDLTIRAETRGVILSLTARPDGDGWVEIGRAHV